MIRTEEYGGVPMSTIGWIENLDEGLQEAGAAKKPLFLDFFKEG
jgi:hypothetical protein